MIQNSPQFVRSRQLMTTVVMTPTGRRRASGFKWFLLVFALLAMALMGLATLFFIGLFNTGLAGLLIGIVMAVTPVPLYLALAIWIDRFEPEPAWMLALTFLWGATGAVFIAFLINSLGKALVGNAFGSGIAEIYTPSVSAPIVEESAKAIALAAIFFFRRHEFDGVLDGIVYAAMVGLGFAMTENFSYYGAAMSENVVIGSFTYVLRNLLAYAHPLFTSMTGIGLGIAVRSNNKAIKVLAPVGGLLLAMVVHSFNNSLIPAFVALAGPNSVLLGMLALVSMMLFFCACVMVVALFALLAEGRRVKIHLQPEVATGFLTQAEVDCLGSVTRRMGASFSALRLGGFAGYRARSRFQHLAAELAFFRNRLAIGLLEQDANVLAQEDEYRTALAELKQKFPAR